MNIHALAEDENSADKVKPEDFFIITEPVIEMPEFVAGPPIKIPDELIPGEKDILVVVRCRVSHDGKIDSILIRESTDARINESVMRSMSLWTCQKPPVINGKPVSMWVEIPFHFLSGKRKTDRARFGECGEASNFNCGSQGSDSDCEKRKPVGCKAVAGLKTNDTEVKEGSGPEL